MCHLRDETDDEPLEDLQMWILIHIQPRFNVGIYQGRKKASHLSGTFL